MINDLIETEDDIKKQLDSSSIGNYKDLPVYVKTGKFGKYLEWNDLKKSLKHVKKNIENISIDDVAEELFDIETQQDNNTNESRVINEDACIRKGKYGYYIYYKNKKMKKPKFLKLDGFNKEFPNDNFFTCDINILVNWFNTTYINT